MKKLHKLALCALALIGLMAPQAMAKGPKGPKVPVIGIAGIASYHIPNYIRAQEILSDQKPEFIKEFQDLAVQISGLQSDDYTGQYKALMDFFPAIEEMLKVEPSVSTDVVVSYFMIALKTADGPTTNVSKLVFNAFLTYDAGGDAIAILSEDTLMQKHNLSQKEAQRIRTTLKKLYNTSDSLQ